MMKQNLSITGTNFSSLIFFRNLSATISALQSIIKLNNEHEDPEERAQMSQNILDLLRFNGKGGQSNYLVSFFNGKQKNFALRAALANLFCQLLRQNIVDPKNDDVFNTIKTFINAIDEKEFLLQKELWEGGFI